MKINAISRYNCCSGSKLNNRQQCNAQRNFKGAYTVGMGEAAHVAAEATATTAGVGLASVIAAMAALFALQKFQQDTLDDDVKQSVFDHEIDACRIYG